MSDGGDGFGDVISRLVHARRQTIKAMDAAHRSCMTGWWWEPQSKTAIIESAAVIGLAMLPPKRFHPFELDTFGLGLVLRKAAEKGARQCLVGVGGSATNDAGFGLARALGWRFLDSNGEAIERWTGLASVVRLRPPRRRRWFEDLVVAVDVKNPLVGAEGATRVYGPQKGLCPWDFDLAERCLHKLARVVRKETGRDLARIPGAGAAGGLGFGFLAFTNARLQPGFALFARQAKLERYLRWADVVITGEGSIDASTLMGKGVGQVAQRCRDLGVPCIGLGGIVTNRAVQRSLFSQTHSLSDLTSLKHAKAKPALWLERLTAKVAADVRFENVN
jgi:glycerate kinase